MRLPSLIRLVVFIVIGAVPVAGQVQAQRLNIDAFLQQWDTDHDGTLSRAAVFHRGPLGLAIQVQEPA